MLKCNQVTQHASAYLDGELPVLTRWRVRLHLKMCEHCRRFVEQLRLTEQLLRLRVQAEDPLVADPDEQAAAVVQQVLAATRPRQS